MAHLAPGTTMVEGHSYKSTAFELEDTDIIGIIFGTSPGTVCIQMIALHSSPWLDEEVTS